MMKTKSFSGSPAICVAFIGLVVVNQCVAQVSAITSATTQGHVFNDVPGDVSTIINQYPLSITLGEAGVSAPTGFADRDVWQFSNNGTTAHLFQYDEYFHASFDLTLVGSPISPRKEAGFLFSTTSNGDIQFVVNTDGHEVVQFGGISFYSFNVNNGIAYNSGDRIRLGMSYFRDANGLNALQFSANGVNSPIFEFAPGNGIGNGSTLGGYFQIINDPVNSANSGTALFENITISTGSEVPRIRSWTLTGGEFILNCIGPPNASCELLATEDCTQPANSWGSVATNSFANNGILIFTNAVDSTAPRRLFALRTR
jgi:hypothetical protein